MLYETRIPAGYVDDKNLRSLAEQFSKVSGKRVEIVYQMIVQTESIEVSAAFEALVDAINAGKPVKVAHQKNGHKKPKVVAAGGVMTSHTRRNVESGEIVSTQALRKAIESGESSLEQTVWEDIKGQRFVVINGELVKEPKS